jgi:hypothetical protein
MPVLNDAQLRALAELGWLVIRGRRASDFVEVEPLIAAIDEALTESRIAKVHGRFVVPGRARVLARAKQSEIKVGAWLPEAVRGPIADALGEPAPLPKKAVEQMVGSEKVRDEVRSMLQDAISGFIKRALGNEDEKGGGGGLRGALGRGALGFAAAGKGLLGGLGDQMQKQLQDKVRDFVDGSVATMQARIVDKLTSEETAKMLGKRRRAFFLETLERTEAQIAKTVEQQQPERLDPLVPKIVAHNAARAELREVVIAESKAVLAELSTQTLGELVDELGLDAHVRAWIDRHAVSLMAEIAARPEFAEWWKGVVGG